MSRFRWAPLSGALAVATAIWLIPASIHIVKWPVSGPVRLAFFAPLWQLAILIAAAIGVAVWLSRRQSPDDSTQSSAPAALLEKCSLLWLWAVPYLPWLPDRFPLLLMLAGPIRYAVPAALAVHQCAGGVAGRRWIARLSRLPRQAIFAASLVLYLSAGLYSAHQTDLLGDEPAYLVIVESLLKDHDLKIENNHQRGDYRSFHPDPLAPDYLRRGKDGAIYSVHAPGLPAVLLPFYAVLGRIGVVTCLALMGALAALAIFDLALALTDQTSAVVTWAATCLTVPFVPHAWLVFPELPALLITAWAALWTWESIDRRWTVWLGRGALVGLLPWMHTKFVILAAVFAGALIVRIWRRPATLLAFGTPFATACALWLYSFYAIYGSINPEVPYGDYSRTYVLFRYIPHGVIGLLFDQKFGLLIYSPVYIAAFAGAWLMFRRADTRWLALTLIVAAGAFTASTARLYMFWGGESAPARFLVPLIACLAPMIAVGVQASRSAAARGLLGLAMAWSLSVSALSAAWPELRFLISDSHGRARVLEWLQSGSPLPWMLPTFTDPDWATQLGPLAVVLALGAVAIGAAVLVARRRGATAWAAAATCAGVLLLGGVMLSAIPDAHVRELTARRGDVEAIWRLDERGLTAFDYEMLTAPDLTRLHRLAAVEAPTTPLSHPRSGVHTGPMSFPAGSYDVAVWFERPAPGNGEVEVMTSPDADVARLVGALGNPTHTRVTLPIGASRFDVFVSDMSVGALVSRVEVVPEAVDSTGDARVAAATIEGLAGRDGAFLGYLDDRAYPEGGVFWSRGTGVARLQLRPAGASHLKLVVYTGPNRGHVRLQVAGESRLVETVPGEAVDVRFDLPAGRVLVPLSVQSDVMFVPKTIDRTSDDDRALGCQVRVVLE